MTEKKQKAPKIRDIETKYPVFSVLANLIYFKNNKDAKKTLPEIVKNVYSEDETSKSNLQTVRNIILSLAGHTYLFGIREKKEVQFLSKTPDNLAERQVNIEELKFALFTLVGEYFITDLGEYYLSIINQPEQVKTLIGLYLEYISNNLSHLSQMSLSDAIVGMEFTMLLVSKKPEIMKQIYETDKDSHKLIKDWAERIEKTIEQDFQKYLPFVRGGGKNGN